MNANADSGERRRRELEGEDRFDRIRIDVARISHDGLVRRKTAQRLDLFVDDLRCREREDGQGLKPRSLPVDRRRGDLHGPIIDNPMMQATTPNRRAVLRVLAAAALAGASAFARAQAYPSRPIASSSPIPRAH